MSGTWFIVGVFALIELLTAMDETYGAILVEGWRAIAAPVVIALATLTLLIAA